MNDLKENQMISYQKAKLNKIDLASFFYLSDSKSVPNSVKITDTTNGYAKSGERMVHGLYGLNSKLSVIPGAFTLAEQTHKNVLVVDFRIAPQAQIRISHRVALKDLMHVGLVSMQMISTDAAIELCEILMSDSGIEFDQPKTVSNAEELLAAHTDRLPHLFEQMPHLSLLAYPVIHPYTGNRAIAASTPRLNEIVEMTVRGRPEIVVTV